MNSTKAMGTFEVANARSSHIVTLHAVDDEAIQQEWEWGKLGDREGVRGVGDPRSPRVHVVPTGAIAEMISDAVATEREACAKAIDGWTDPIGRHPEAARALREAAAAIRARGRG